MWPLCYNGRVGASQAVGVSGNFRNNLYRKLHVCFSRDKDLAQIRDSQRVLVMSWWSGGCVVDVMLG